MTAADSFGISVPQASELVANTPQPAVGAEVIRDTLWIQVHARATAAALGRVVVNSQVEGIIQEIPVRENSRVDSAGVLVRIDPSELELEVEQARATLTQARAEFLAATLGDDSIADPEVREQRALYARAQTGLAGAEVALEQAELRFRRATVRAPFGGRVADLRVVPGQFVSAGTELMTVVDLDPIRIEAEVLEGDFDLLREGHRAVVTIDAFPDEQLSGTVRSINPVLDANGAGRATILVANPDGRIKPGMGADVWLDAQSFPDRILIPSDAVIERERGRPMVLVFEGEDERGAVASRYVRVGLASASQGLVEVVPSEDTEMVEPGDIVLVAGHRLLDDGTPVSLVESMTDRSAPGP
jgi:RND family efflux transporter MFP subunit